MIVKIKKEIEVNVKSLHVDAGVRYWNDATMNGAERLEDDDDGIWNVNLDFPCRSGGNRWRPEINIADGRITNWDIGKTADIHFKVCDDGTYRLMDDKNNEVLVRENDYVPGCLCPKGNGFGDYIIMDIDANGYIQDWHFDIEDFS